ncbi:N-acetyllactosaminide 3-alpha-galactosyltransferase [Aphelenchoides fujianensis]|nr:N-acetyllactosaminide 3-alpha-galactosyltransferase [Aphelenchoides fujianensis]
MKRPLSCVHFRLHSPLLKYSPFFSPTYRIENDSADVFVSPAARALPPNGSALVFVMTAPQFHETRVRAVGATWLRRVPHGVVFTSERLEEPAAAHRTVFAGFSPAYGRLFHKTLFAFRYAFTHISDRFDFYVKADDDTYIVAENLQHFLSTLDPEEPIYAGCRLRSLSGHDYNSGGAYVLSRAAVRLLVERGWKNESACPFDEFEDVGMAVCLARAGVRPLRTRDAAGRSRFLMHDAWTTFEGPRTERERAYFFEDFKTVGGRDGRSDGRLQGFAEFSPSLISLHHLSPAEMLTADLFLYRVRLPNRTSVEQDGA